MSKIKSYKNFQSNSAGNCTICLIKTTSPLFILSIGDTASNRCLGLLEAKVYDFHFAFSLNFISSAGALLNNKHIQKPAFLSILVYGNPQGRSPFEILYTKFKNQESALFL